MRPGGLDERARARVRAAVQTEATRPAPPEVETLVGALRARFGETFAGALFYGSCRRHPDPDGIFDLHVLVHDLRQALGPLQGALCRLLPPTVAYLEVPYDGTTVRCKYAVLSLRQFRRGCSRVAFHSYFWGRYAQPLTLVGVDADELPARLDDLVTAVETLARRALPRLGPVPDARSYWSGALRLSYRAELRPEGDDRALALVDAHHDYYHQTGEALLAALAAPQRVSAASRLDWGVRIVLGKLLSVGRLLKGLFTFDGALDYVAWKLERHTGVPVEITPAARRRPLLYLWPLVWRLWRQRVFR